jgi:hypothetical protein
MFIRLLALLKFPWYKIHLVTGIQEIFVGQLLFLLKITTFFRLLAGIHLEL